MKKTIKAYDICYPNPLSLNEGDEVEVLKSEQDDSEWFGWHYCKDQDGNEGWISNDFMALNNNKGTLIKSYSAKELSAETGEDFEILSRSFGWYWCSNKNKEMGWLPCNIFSEE